MSKKQYGEGADSVILSATRSDTTPAVSTVVGFLALDSAGAQLITTSTLQGAWKVEASNDYVANSTGTAYGQGTTTAHWSDVTAFFTISASGTAIAAVTTASSQFAQSTIRTRALRFTFTPSSGSGTVLVILYAASTSA